MIIIIGVIILVVAVFSWIYSTSPLLQMRHDSSANLSQLLLVHFGTSASEKRARFGRRTASVRISVLIAVVVHTGVDKQLVKIVRLEEATLTRVFEDLVGEKRLEDLPMIDLLFNRSCGQ